MSLDEKLTRLKIGVALIEYSNRTSLKLLAEEITKIDNIYEFISKLTKGQIQGSEPVIIYFKPEIVRPIMKLYWNLREESLELKC